MFKDKHKLVLIGKCYASCANYLVPAAHHRLEVKKGAVILLYGAFERGRSFYVARSIRDQKIGFSKSKKTGELFFNSESTAKIQKLFNDYPTYYQEFIIPESQYFVDIDETDEFITRYYEIRRNIDLYAHATCHHSIFNFYLVVGPHYLEKITDTPEIQHFWWPEDKSEIVNRLGHISKQSVLVFDTELMPGWISGKGFVKQSDCLKSS